MKRQAPDPAVVALARDVERLAERISQLEAAMAEAHRLADVTHRLLADLIERIAAADRLTSPPSGDRTSTSGGKKAKGSWLANPEPAALDGLLGWLEQILAQYPGTTEALGQCWSHHP